MSAERWETIKPSSDRAVIQISRRVHERLTKIKDDQTRERQRQVSFTEVIEQLLESSSY